MILEQHQELTLLYRYIEKRIRMLFTKKYMQKAQEMQKRMGDPPFYAKNS